jgi:hypothetical protein
MLRTQRQVQCDRSEASADTRSVNAALFPWRGHKDGDMDEAVQGACLPVVAQHGGVVLKLSGNVAVTLLRAARS